MIKNNGFKSSKNNRIWAGAVIYKSKSTTNLSCRQQNEDVGKNFMKLNEQPKQPRDTQQGKQGGDTF